MPSEVHEGNLPALRIALSWTILGPFPSCMMLGKLLFLTVPSQKSNRKRTPSLHTLRNSGMTKRKNNHQTSVGQLDGGRKAGGKQNKQSGRWEGEGTAGILTS